MITFKQLLDENIKTKHNLTPKQIDDYLDKGWILYDDEGVERLEGNDTNWLGGKTTKVIYLTTASVDRYHGVPHKPRSKK